MAKTPTKNAQAIADSRQELHQNSQKEAARSSVGERVAEMLGGKPSPELQQFTRELLKQHQQQDFERTQIRDKSAGLELGQ